jgi:hypothetical protein
METRGLRWAAMWQAECEQAAFHAATLLRLVGRFPTNITIMELVRQAPHSPDEEQDPEVSFFMRCTRAAHTQVQDYQRELFNSVLDYFHRLSTMKPARRTLLEASVAGVVTGMGG